MNRLSGVLISVLVAAAAAQAQHPIDVQRKTAQGEYFEALSVFEKMPRRQETVDSVVAAGKAAWALGLPERAIEEFDKALRSENLDDVRRARLMLSRGIIEFQEGRYQVAILYAEKVCELLITESPLRGRGWLLWGESLRRLNSYGAAEHKYHKALAEAAPAELAEVHYLIGETQIRLGKGAEARGNFERVPLHHERTPAAIRYLAALAIEAGKFDQAAFWLTRGRHDYPDAFLDSWVDYALLQVAVYDDNRAEVRRIQAQAQQKYPPSDQWLSLLNAAVEVYEWKGRGSPAKSRQNGE